MPRKAAATKIPKAVQALMDIPEVEKAIRARLPTLIQRMFDLADGVLVLERKIDKETGEEVQRVYAVPPDRQALQYLIESVIGKTPQRIEMTGKGGGPMQITPWAPMEEMRAAGMLPDENIPEAEVRELPSGA